MFIKHELSRKLHIFVTLSSNFFFLHDVCILIYDVYSLFIYYFLCHLFFFFFVHGICVLIHDAHTFSYSQG